MRMIALTIALSSESVLMSRTKDWSISHEGLVDLELVRLELLEVAQGRVTGTKVVDRHPYAARVQLVHHRYRPLRIVHRDALGHFELETRRRQLLLVEDPRHPIRQVGVPELHRR